MGEESQQTRRCWSSIRNPAKLPQGATLMAIGVLWNWPKLLLLSCVELHGKPRGEEVWRCETWGSWICFVGDFFTDCTRGFITMKPTTIWENMFGSLFPFAS